MIAKTLFRTALCAAISISSVNAYAQTPVAFDFNVILSPKAEKALVSAKEGITFAASYYADPKKGAEKHANEVGQIDLGIERVDLPGKPGNVHVTGGDFDPKRLKWIEGPIYVNVNVFSSRKSGPDNILSCDFIDTELKNVTGQVTTLTCFLIEENAQTQVRP
ncbi:hypothetical protein [Pararhizobium arenae]|uniref:hypothetical protein n=1 Tax=Pararhizobium arenae TaxID=1856850 RepID=UPI00094B0E84|nr:hypothetical protein [Pararhizobium arenae]